MKKKITLSLIGVLLLILPLNQTGAAQGLTVNLTQTHPTPVASPRQEDTAARTLYSVLQHLKKVYHIHFIYQDKTIQGQKIKSSKTSNVSDINTLLKGILSPVGLRYVKLDAHNYAIVRHKSIPDTATISKITPPVFSLYEDSPVMQSAFSATLSKDHLTLPQKTIRITGKVISSKNQKPLAGVTVIAKGSKEAAYTHSDGHFFLHIPENTSYIIFRYVGYQTEKVKVKKGKSIYNITLIPKVTGLSEVVVNGIFERPISNFTGAARSFSEQDMRQVSNRNVFDALKSLDPSFKIPENLDFGSDPNHLPKIQIRGQNSIADLSGNDNYKSNLKEDYRNDPNIPLFILDGFQVDLRKIYDLDMNRVKNVTILKDAAATAVYGSKAANGVVVIETKQPKPGKLRVSYTGNFTLSGPDLSSYHLLDAEQKLGLEKVAGIYHADLPDNQLYLDELYNERLKDVRKGVNTYWLSQPLRTGFGHKHSLHLEGGTKTIRYGVNGSYHNNAGVMKGSHRNSYSGGTYLSYRYKNFTFKNTLQITSTHAVNSPYGSFGDYSALNPYWRKKDSSGHILKKLESFTDYYYSTGGSKIFYNPLYRTTLNSKNFSRNLNIVDQFQAIWQISNPLKLQAQFSIESNKDHYERFVSGLDNSFADYTGSDFFRRGRYTMETGNAFKYQGRVTLNYGKAFGKNVVYATGGFHMDNDKAVTNGFVAEGFPNDRLDDIAFAHQYQKGSKPYGSESLARSVSFLINGSYSYDSRYLLDVSFREDGSSRFGSNKRFAPFWSVGIGWNLHKESFLKSSEFVERLKVRASYGSTGSQNFPSYMALTTYDYNTGERYRTGIGATLKGIGNSDLQWEQTYKTNIGADLTLWNNRINLTVNYYTSKTNGLITAINLPPSIGFSQYNANLGKVQNKGIEAYLTAFLYRNKRKNIYWSVNANLTHNENKIIEISNALKQQNEDQIVKQQQNDDPVTVPVILYEEGQSVNTIYAVPSKGIDPSTGQEIFVKKNGQLTYDWSPLDEVPQGNSDATVYGTFGTYVMYKGLSLNVSFRTNLGGQTYNSTLANRVENADLYQNVDYRVLADRWKTPGDVTPFKGLTTLDGTTRFDVTKATSRFIQDYNILYCDVITLGYKLPEAMLNNWKISRLQAFFYIHDPFVVSSVKQERGLSYPFARTYTLSLQVSF